MRIAYVCADLGIPVFGQKGCSIHVQEVIRALLHQGATVELFAVRCEGTPPAGLEDVIVHPLPPVPKGDRAMREQRAIALNDDVYAALASNGPFDIIYERYSLWSCSAMEFAQRSGIPGILEVNAPLIEEQAQYRGLVHQAQAEHISAKAFSFAKEIIAVSQDVRAYLSEWVNPNKIHVIPNGVNRQRFFPESSPTQLSAFSKATASEQNQTSAQHTIQPDVQANTTFTVGFVGSLKPWHGLSHLVNAFSQLHQRVPEARLLVVGDGPQKEDITAALEAQHLLPFTHFTGAVSPAEIPALLAKMDTAVAPYPADVNFYFSPLKVVEYMAAGLPVVVSRLGQLTILVEEGKTGLLCPAGDEKALAEALEKLWRSPDLRDALGQAAKQHILEHHTWDSVAKQIFVIAALEHYPQEIHTVQTGSWLSIPKYQEVSR